MAAARKTTARKTATRRPAAVSEDAPLVLSSKREEDVERKVAFVIDDVEYTVPVKVSKSYSVKMLRLAREVGFEAAMYEGMTDFYGEDAMEALENADLTEENWEAVQKIFVRTVYGEDAVKEAEKGKSRR